MTRRYWKERALHAERMLRIVEGTLASAQETKAMQRETIDLLDAENKRTGEALQSYVERIGNPRLEES